jgi:hypothetical protein
VAIFIFDKKTKQLTVGLCRVCVSTRKEKKIVLVPSAKQRNKWSKLTPPTSCVYVYMCAVISVSGFYLDIAWDFFLNVKRINFFRSKETQHFFFVTNWGVTLLHPHTQTHSSSSSSGGQAALWVCVSVCVFARERVKWRCERAAITMQQSLSSYL